MDLSFRDMILVASFLFSLVSFILVYHEKIVGPKIRFLLPRNGMKLAYEMPGKGRPHYKFWDGDLDRYEPSNDFGNCNMPLQMTFANDGSNAATVTDFDIYYPGYSGRTKKVWDFLFVGESGKDIVVPVKGAQVRSIQVHLDFLFKNMEIQEGNGSFTLEFAYRTQAKRFRGFGDLNPIENRVKFKVDYFYVVESPPMK